MIGQKLILPSRVQAEIYEVALSYAPVLLLMLTHFHYLLVGARGLQFLSQQFSTRGNLLALSRGSENSRELLTLKVKNRVRVLGVKV